MSSTSSDTITKTVLKVPSMWKVLLHNDDFTPMDFVTNILKHIFHKSNEDAEKIMMAVHENGIATVGLYTKEVAVTKTKQVSEVSEQYGHPLMCTCEEA